MATDQIEVAVDRPDMPIGYGVSTHRKPKPLPWSWATERLEASRNYWIVTASPTGRPHAAPVWGVWVDDLLAWSTDPAARKARNLAANPEVVVHLESGDEAVILEGRVEHPAPSERELVKRLDRAYRKKYPGTGLEGGTIYLLRPRVALGWLETDFPATATRWRFTRR